MRPPKAAAPGLLVLILAVPPPESWWFDAAPRPAPLRARVAAAGDVDADGFRDLLMITVPLGGSGTVSLHRGSPSGPSARASWTVPGESAAAGDLNGDGRDDLVIGAPSRGSIAFYAGSPVGPAQRPDWAAEGWPTGARFGAAVAIAGDVDGDGFADLLVGAPGDDGGRGRVLLYRGSSAGPGAEPSWSAAGEEPAARFGESVAGAGDQNGDGYADILAGAPGTGGGHASFFRGSSRGPEAVPSWTVSHPQPGAGFGASLAGGGDVNGDGYPDILVGAPMEDGPHEDGGRIYAYLGSARGPATLPAWSVTGDQPGGRLGEALAFAGDLNADGFDDVAAGQPGHDGAGANAGRVLVFAGTGNGPTRLPSWIGLGENEFARLGASLAGAGDVNGDGYPDLALVERLHLRAGRILARATVRPGSLSGLHARGWILEGFQPGALFGTSVSGAGDVDGDGYDDLIVGALFAGTRLHEEGAAFLYPGSTAGPAAAPAWITHGGQRGATLGTAVAGAGDVDGDGFDDVIVGAPLFDNGELNEGRALLFRGSSAGLMRDPAWTTEGDQDYARLGAAVAGAGDVNGDGFADIIVSAPGFDTGGGTRDGAVLLFLGSPSGLSHRPYRLYRSDAFEARFGAAIAGAGDVNGDGYDDFIVGAPAYRNRGPSDGRVFIFLGSATGPGDWADWSIGGDRARGLLGASVAGAGDLDGDGYDDVVAGSPGWSERGRRPGRAFVYFGSPDGSLRPGWSAGVAQDGSFFGISVAGPGDLDGDGYDDLLIGARFWDGERSDEGGVFVFPGSSNGPSTAPVWIGQGGRAGAHLGSAVARAGDVNGDGFADMVAGSRGHSDGGPDTGRVLIVPGSPLGPSGLRRVPAP